MMTKYVWRLTKQFTAKVNKYGYGLELIATIINTALHVYVTPSINKEKKIEIDIA